MKELKRGLQSMVGMGDRLGLVTYERARQSIFLPESFTPGKTTVKESRPNFLRHFTFLDDCLWARILQQTYEVFGVI